MVLIPCGGDRDKRLGPRDTVGCGSKTRTGFETAFDTSDGFLAAERSAAQAQHIGPERPSRIRKEGLK
ncbi:hypothetical protein CLV78_111120 [Aliiruegeria haliotis]|uniref:Uncharacterized protein n=1 Tax=Aliiruegeria haliotis TaxID=1280846 RepID=A0A2T0RIF9_9RHOB|nr:hypothetical protein [Aliiruegeria haliotis]PRY20965.1 hypothetical protein CLV78_111120 [Aliiruegeria haliotis]